MATATPTKKDARRRQLLGVALELFAEKGFHATTVSDIIARAGVARGTFYNYFESKRQIFGQGLDALFEVVTAPAFPIRLGGAEAVQAQVRENIAAISAALSRNLPLARVLLEQAVGLDAEANAQLQRFYDRVLSRIQRALERGQAMGIVREGDAAVLAVCLLGMIKEALYQQMLGTRTPALETLVAEIYETAVRGILREPPAG